MSFNSLTVKLTDHTAERSTQNEDNKEINEYYIHELLNPSKKLSKQRRIKLISEGHQRIIWPMYNLALSALVPIELQTILQNAHSLYLKF